MYYLTGENKTKQDGDCQLTMAEEDNIQKIRVCWMLQEKPKKGNKFSIFLFMIIFYSCFVKNQINLVNLIINY